MDTTYDTNQRLRLSEQRRSIRRQCLSPDIDLIATAVAIVLPHEIRLIVGRIDERRRIDRASDRQLTEPRRGRVIDEWTRWSRGADGVRHTLLAARRVSSRVVHDKGRWTRS